MQYLGIEYQMKHAPKLDPTFIPFGVWRAAYLKGATKPLAIALERDKGRVSVHKTFIHGTAEMAEADRLYRQERGTRLAANAHDHYLAEKDRKEGY